MATTKATACLGGVWASIGVGCTFARSKCIEEYLCNVLCIKHAYVSIANLGHANRTTAGFL